MDNELVFKSYRLHIKSAQGDGMFEGYASTHSLDSDGEIVDPGAFKRTLDPANKGDIFPILWGHDREVPVGWSTSAVEDDKGLFIRAKMLMDSEQGRYAYNFIQVGLAVGGRPGLSIGFQVPKGGDYYKDGVRHFREVALRETSVCVFQANPNAVVTGTKGAVSYQDLPLASEDTSWDASAARESLAKWAGGPSKEAINFGKYKRGFLWYDSSAPSELGSYKLPIATVINGRLTAVPKAIYACAGGHGVNASDIPAADKPKVIAVINKYYKKLGKDSPLKAESTDSIEQLSPTEEETSMAVKGKLIEFKMDDFMSTMQRNKDIGEHYDDKYKMDSALRQTMDSIHSSKDLKPAEKKAKMSESLDQHCKCMKSWWGKLVDITTPAEGEDEVDDEKLAEIAGKLTKGEHITEKEGRAISAATKDKLDKAIGSIKTSMAFSKDSHAEKTKALGHLTDLSHGRYWNDVNPPNPVGGTVTDPDANVTTNPLGGGKAFSDLSESLAKVKASLQVLAK